MQLIVYNYRDLPYTHRNDSCGYNVFHRIRVKNQVGWENVYESERENDYPGRWMSNWFELTESSHSLSIVFLVRNLMSSADIHESIGKICFKEFEEKKFWSVYIRRAHGVTVKRYVMKWIGSFVCLNQSKLRHYHQVFFLLRSSTLYQTQTDINFNNNFHI